MLLPQPPGGDVVRTVVCLAVAGDGDEKPLSLEADEPSADRGGDCRSPQPVVEGRNLTAALTSFETVDRVPVFRDVEPAVGDCVIAAAGIALTHHSGAGRESELGRRAPMPSSAGTGSKRKNGIARMSATPLLRQVLPKRPIN
jgi:hypothetical protein